MKYTWKIYSVTDWLDKPNYLALSCKGKYVINSDLSILLKNIHQLYPKNPTDFKFKHEYNKMKDNGTFLFTYTPRTLPKTIIKKYPEYFI